MVFVKIFYMMSLVFSSVNAIAADDDGFELVEAPEEELPEVRLTEPAVVLEVYRGERSKVIETTVLPKLTLTPLQPMLSLAVTPQQSSHPSPIQNPSVSRPEVLSPNMLSSEHVCEQPKEKVDFSRYQNGFLCCQSRLRSFWSTQLVPTMRFVGHELQKDLEEILDF